jgi:hypothetical protein
MGVDLLDCATDEVVFSINYWHYRAIVEAIRRLDLLSDSKVDSLHEPCCGNGLSTDEARLVGEALRQRILPVLAVQDRLMLGGEITSLPDDTVFHCGEDLAQNYSTTAKAVLEFILCCETCNGFTVC